MKKEQTLTKEEKTNRKLVLFRIKNDLKQMAIVLKKEKPKIYSIRNLISLAYCEGVQEEYGYNQEYLHEYFAKLCQDDQVIDCWGKRKIHLVLWYRKLQIKQSALLRIYNVIKRQKDSHKLKTNTYEKYEQDREILILVKELKERFNFEIEKREVQNLLYDPLSNSWISREFLSIESIYNYTSPTARTVEV